MSERDPASRPNSDLLPWRVCCNVSQKCFLLPMVQLDKLSDLSAAGNSQCGAQWQVLRLEIHHYRTSRVTQPVLVAPRVYHFQFLSLCLSVSLSLTHSLSLVILIEFLFSATWNQRRFTPGPLSSLTKRAWGMGARNVFRGKVFRSKVPILLTRD